MRNSLLINKTNAVFTIILIVVFMALKLACNSMGIIKTLDETFLASIYVTLAIMLILLPKLK